MTITLFQDEQSCSSSTITLQNKLDALRDTERGLIAHDCFVRCRREEVPMSLLTIMVTTNIFVLSANIFAFLQRGLLAPHEIAEVDVRAVQKKAEARERRRMRNKETTLFPFSFSLYTLKSTRQKRGS